MSNGIVSKKERNYGVDALRIISMGMVVILHILGQGGVLKNTSLFSTNYFLCWLFEILAYGAVNCYALISGYVGIHSQQKYRNIFLLWFQVVFYTLGITLMFFIIKPELVGLKKVFQACFPVLTKRYWYFTAYFCLFFAIPILNFIVQNIDRKKLETAIFTGFILFSIFPTFTLKDQFLLNNGYSFLWLAYLYLIGGYISKYNVFKNISSQKLLVSFFAFSCLTWLTKILIELVTINLFEEIRYNMMFVKYISPTILIASILLFAYFVKVDFSEYKHMISFISPLSFGVYLIHVHPLVWKNIMLNRFSFLAHQSSIVLVFGLVACLFVIYCLCLMIEYLRFHLFKTLKIKEICINLEEYVLNSLRKINLL